MSEYSLNVRSLNRGRDVSIGDRTLIGAIDGEAAEVRLGDNVSIGEDVRILAPRVRIGDFTTIHHHTTIYGYDEVSIGDCCWIGQNAILNCTAPLAIARGCTISAYSTIWTHFSGGDPVEGCNLGSLKPCTLGEDVWIGVQCSIAPVSIAAKSVVLAGSVVTKDIAANRVYGGNPAVDLTGKLGEPYSKRPDKEKFEGMCKLLREFLTGSAGVPARDKPKGGGQGRPPSHLVSPARGNDGEERGEGWLRLGGIAIAMADCPVENASLFDVRDRTYSKLRSVEEIAFMHFLLPQVKFYPRAGAAGRVIPFKR